jgi:lipopolysaccharide/colanic/teichoic acid biosynthesis glycosyltransferase
VQRIFDLIFSILAIIILFPLLLPIIIILRITGEREIFYFQNRIGREKKEFKLYKFATMLKDSPNMSTGTITLKNDFRVLPFGKILRKTKINELPQLLNIVLGDMSLVGPRPQTGRCFSAFPQADQIEILKMRPGLSGLGSIIFKEEEKMLSDKEDSEAFYDNVIMPYKGKIETWYVKNASISLYFRIIFLTIFVMILPFRKIIWRIFKDLPKLPKDLESFFKI